MKLFFIMNPVIPILRCLSINYFILIVKGKRYFDSPKLRHHKRELTWSALPLNSHKR